ncbi:uncharacterized protein LOC141628945 [Silene latifolia]|uniref:uncharacterized protein LOC141628945 n=1 Tax=Silene latifolia TaxID=37657 RepID=UPI003D77F6B7
MCSKGLKQGEKVQMFPLVNKKFKWQSKDFNLDCGVFMMLHMMFYNGEIFDCDLNDEMKRKLYRAEIATALVFSDYNHTRTETMDTVTKFDTLKESLEPILLEKRRLKREEEEKEKANSLKKVCTPKSKIKGLKRPDDNDCNTSVLGSRRKGNSDGLGCTYNCGKAGDILVVSKFMRNNQALLASLLKVRKEVLDYCLLDDHTFSIDECVAVYGEEAKLLREDILSIQQNVNVTSKMIECWAHLLNDIEYKDHKDNNFILFLGLPHMDVVHALYQQGGDESQDETHKMRIFEAWDTFITANNEKVEVLDNTSYDKWEDTSVYKLADIVASCMSDYLEAKKRPKAEEIIGFNIVNVSFKWQKPELKNSESGTFLMLHMIRYYWAEMAAGLVLADINGIREQVIQKVAEFTAIKEEVWPQLKLKRDASMNKKPVKGGKGEDVQKPVNTEMPVLRSSPKSDIVNGQNTSGGQRIKTIAQYARARGRGRGGGRGINVGK